MVARRAGMRVNERVDKRAYCYEKKWVERREKRWVLLRVGE
jgi:hypothetical protein